MITYSVDGVKMPKFHKRKANKWIREVAATYGRKVGEIGYMFVDDERILKCNREYLGHDYYTDIITFDYDEDDIINGDIVISLDTVRTNAEKYAKSYDDEFHRVLIHGILHLCGINDKGPENVKLWRPTRIKPWPSLLRCRNRPGRLMCVILSSSHRNPC